MIEIMSLFGEEKHLVVFNDMTAFDVRVRNASGLLPIVQ
jgi:hypothetical protein